MVAGVNSPNMCDRLKSRGNPWKCAFPKHHGQLGQSSDFEVGLNLIERLAMRGIANAEAIIGQSAVFILIGSDIDIAIIEVVI